MKKFLVSQPTNLKDFTDGVYPQGGFCLAALLRERDVKVNGVRVSKNVLLNIGDEVVYFTTLKQESMLSHAVVYEDQNVYIADKFSGVSFEGLLSELNEKGGFYAVHRLDRNTQGLIVFAKTESAQSELLKAFKQRRVIKKYIALCKNSFMAKKAVLTAYLLKDEKRGEVSVYSSERNGAVKIVTEYEVVQERGDIALAEVVLHTGKTHQIRAHMAHIGCPVLGDEKYGDGRLNAKYGAKRQRLVAKYLTFDLYGDLEYLNGKTFESSFEL